MTIRTPPLGIETRKATFTPSTVNTDKRTVELVWSTGAKVLRSSWAEGQFYEELDMKGAKLDRLNNGAPLLADHDGSSVLRVYGVVESARVTNGQGIAVVRFDTAENDPDADKLFRKIANGIVQNVSVGYRTHKIEKVTAEGEKIPTFRVTSWTPFEISAVTMGADDAAGFRSSTHKEQHTMKIKRQQEDGNGGGGGIVPDATQMERERIAGIRESIRTAKLEESIGAEMIRAGVSLADARKQILEILAERSDAIPTDNHYSDEPAPRRGRITAGESSSEKFVRGATAALIERCSAGSIVRAAKAAKAPGFEKLDLDGGEFRGMSMVELCREALTRAGVNTRGMGRMAIIGEALTHRAGTGDFPVLLENVLSKVLVGAYATAPDTWSKWVKTELVNDFREAHFYRQGTFGPLDIVPEGAEYTNKAIPDGSKLSISTQTRGNIITISRQALINDDMGALTSLSAQLGRAAKLSIENACYALLAQNGGLGPTQADSEPFFHSNRANVGASAGLSVAGLDADRVILASQKDMQENEFLDNRPAILLVPIGLGGQARILNTSDFDHDDSKLQKPNAVKNIVREVVDSPRLSGTRRYMFADPNVCPAVICAFLQETGTEPYLEQQQGWRVDGTEFKARIDFMAQMGDPKGAVTNAGT